MDPAFEPTNILGQPQPSDQPAPPPLGGLPRACQAAAVLLALLALGLAALAAMTPPQAHPEAALACALGSLGLLRLGAAWQRRRLASQGWLDAATGLCNRQALTVVGGQLLEQTRRERRPLSLVVLDFSDLQEVREIYGRETSHKVLLKVVRKVQAIAGSDGLAVRTGKTQFSLMIPGATRERAVQKVQKVLGKPSRVEFDAGDSEIVLVPDLLAETAAPAVEGIDELYREMARTLGEHREYERKRQSYLTRERERHSRPMGLPGR